MCVYYISYNFESKVVKINVNNYSLVLSVEKVWFDNVWNYRQ